MRVSEIKVGLNTFPQWSTERLRYGTEESDKEMWKMEWDICLISVSEQEKRENGAEAIFGEIMTSHFLQLMKNTNPEIEKFQWILSKMDK